MLDLKQMNSLHKPSERLLFCQGVQEFFSAEVYKLETVPRQKKLHK
ncbi:hypothetical protein KKC1_25660 [Calderihabitans maritimus]|uniref:Uncharacterized protein n=1 Tax=Calderihabitans maritimus TaxID=1246530 RepID=A0A1Z5HV88_9FIRM|nr:hypothetical protein KKC1_25660 [Calderihabitans maritimus]